MVLVTSSKFCISFPPHPASPTTRRSHKGRLYGRGSGVLDIFSGFGGGAPHPQSHGDEVRHFLSNYSFFLARNFAVSLYFAQTLLRNAKLVWGCQNCEFCFFKTPEVLQSYAGFLAPTWHVWNVTRFFVPPLNGLRRLGGWGKGIDNISDYELALSPPQFHFTKDTIKEFIIVFQNETVVK